jgi:hypothetical protein
MRGDSGVDVLSGALKSTLGRAQKAYKFHGENSSYNSELNKKRRKKLDVSASLVYHCQDIGSQFAFLSLEQLEEYGDNLKFEAGGVLPSLITEELKAQYKVLSEEVGPPAGVAWLPSYPFEQGKQGQKKKKCPSAEEEEDPITPLLLEKAKREKGKNVRNGLQHLQAVNGNGIGVLTPGGDVKPNKVKKASCSTTDTASATAKITPTTLNTISVNSTELGDSPSKKKVALAAAGKDSNAIEKILKLIQDKTIGKNRKKRLLKKVKKLQKLQGVGGGGDSLTEIVELGVITKGAQLGSNNISNKQQQQTITVQKPKKLVEQLVNGKGLGGNSAAASAVGTSGSDKVTADALLKSKKSQKLALLTKGMGPDTAKNGGDSVTNGHSPSSNHQLPQPKRVLFPKENIVLGWRAKRGPGAGFHNFGNTCYLNSSLQALFHVPAFVNWLQTEEEHRSLCNGNNCK